LTGHVDREIRLAAVQGIVFCDGSDGGQDTQPICDVLLSLMEDEDDEIRDWVTTGLARQLDDDNRVIRTALSKRMSDPGPGVRYEAIVGLARRHARDVVEDVRRALLDDTVDRRVLQAASISLTRNSFRCCNRSPRVDRIRPQHSRRHLPSATPFSNSSG
jgi:hypothetical protein